jgi:hypothetical protein
LSAENLLTGNVWRWFMTNDAISRGMDLAGFSSPPHAAPAPVKNKSASVKRARKPQANRQS